VSTFLSRADKTVTRCTIDIDLDPATQVPRAMHMIVLTGVRGEDGKAPKGKAFDGGTEHVAFHFDYKLDTQREVARFEIPRDAQKLMK
jgi:hypothetical protein